MQPTTFATTIISATLATSGALAQVSGRPVPDMQAFDTDMLTFMTANEIEAGVLGIMYDGNIVYLRGFGFIDGTNELPENALWRLASVTKPITAAAIRVAEDQGYLDVSDLAFNVNNNGGTLTVTPFGGLGDNRIANITIDHLLNHEGGWDDDITDHTYKEREIADDMGVASPPGRTRTMNWILGRGLSRNPGAGYFYNNAGFLALGLILTQETGGHLSYIRNHVMHPGIWIPSTEVIQSRSFKDWGSIREPWYRNSPTVESVFDTRPGFVERAYGGVDLEARLGQGGICASAAAMLTFAQYYRVGYNGRDIGEHLSELPLADGEINGHNGSQAGLGTLLMQLEQDGHQINVFMAFNRRPSDTGGSGHLASILWNNTVGPRIMNGTGFSWPTTTSDGFWVYPHLNANLGWGNYDAPYWGVGTLLANVTNGTKVRMRAGNSNWTGVINTQLLIDAPLGDCAIGVE